MSPAPASSGQEGSMLDKFTIHDTKLHKQRGEHRRKQCIWQREGSEQRGSLARLDKIWPRAPKSQPLWVESPCAPSCVHVAGLVDEQPRVQALCVVAVPVEGAWDERIAPKSTCGPQISVAPGPRLDAGPSRAPASRCCVMMVTLLHITGARPPIHVCGHG